MRRLRPVVLVTLAALAFSIDARGVVDHPRTHASIPHHRLGRPLAADTASAKEDPCTGPGSGPRAVAHLAGGRAIKSGSAAKSAPEPCLYRTGFNAAEPTLGVAKDGTIYYQTLDAEQWPAFPVQVIRSTDEGRTWKDVSPKFGPSNRHAYTEDPYIYLDAATGRVFTVDYLLPCSELSFTDDGGKNWTTVVMGCDVVDHQTIFSGPPVEGGSEPIGYKNIVYYCAADVGLASNSGQATCLKSLDGGLTFVRTGEPAFPVAGDEGAVGNDGDPIVECDGLHGHGVADRDGNIYLPKGVCGQPWLAISADEGLTWERMQVAKNGTPTHEAGVAVDPVGSIYYTWIGMDRLPYLAISKNRGKNWSDPIMVGAPGVNEASLPGIAVGETGKVALIYMGSTNSPGEPWTDPYAEVTWNGYMVITDDALAKQPVFYTGTVNNPREPLIKGECGPFRCQAAFDFLDVVIARDGTPWASFVDGCIEENCNASGRFLRLGEAVVGRLVGGPKLR